MGDVYEPAEDTHLVLSSLKNRLERHRPCRCLEMGCGSGIITAEAARHADSVLAVDINPRAVAATRKAVAGLKNVVVRRGDLFSGLKKQPYDVIIFNPPYLPVHPGAEDVALDGGRKGHELLCRFLDEALPFLAPEGEMLVLYSTLTGPARVNDEIRRLCLESELLGEEKLWFETLFLVSVRRSPLLAFLEAQDYGNISLFARGKRGLVYRAELGKKTVAIKTAHPDSLAINRIENEASWLERLNREGIGPERLAFWPAEGGRPACLAMAFVEGEPILNFLKSAGASKAKKTLRDVMRQMLILDTLGVNKGEMHTPVKHVLVRKTGEPVLLDFERCRHTERPKNVTQFCQFLASESVQALLREKGIRLQKEQVLGAARAYASGDKKPLLRMMCGTRPQGQAQAGAG